MNCCRLSARVAGHECVDGSRIGKTTDQIERHPSGEGAIVDDGRTVDRVFCEVRIDKAINRMVPSVDGFRKFRTLQREIGCAVLTSHEWRGSQNHQANSNWP